MQDADRGQGSILCYRQPTEEEMLKKKAMSIITLYIFLSGHHSDRV